MGTGGCAFSPLVRASVPLRASELLSQVDRILSTPRIHGRRHRRLVQMTAAADSHLALGERAGHTRGWTTTAPPGPTVRPFTGHLHRRLPGQLRLHQLHNRWCTDAGPSTGSPTQFHAPTHRREGRECLSYQCGAVCMCVCHGVVKRGRTERRYCKP